MKVLSWINFVLGLWLIAAAFVFSTGAGAVMTEEIVIGIIIAALAYASTVGRPSAAVSWLVAVAGLWTLIAPSIIAYGLLRTARTNDIVVGIVVLVLGFANAMFRESPVRTNA